MQMWLLVAICSCLIVLSTAGLPPIRHRQSSNRNDESITDRQYSSYNDNNNGNYNSNYNSNYNNNNKSNYNYNNNGNYNSNHNGNYNYNKYETTTRRQVPLELQLNFTFPENGLPPLKLNMGAVSQYLNEMSDKIRTMNGSFVPEKMKKTLLVQIKNPNKPFRPIPADVFAAGLPKGALIPGNVVQPCRKFIVSTCNALCRVQLTSCSFLCDDRRDCLTSCESSLATCSSFCDSTFSQLDDRLKVAGKGADDKLDSTASLDSATKAPQLDEFKNEIPNVNFYLPKCLQNCGGNATCIGKCHHVCHGIWMKPAPQYSQAPVQNSRPYPVAPSLPIGYPPMAAPPASSYPVGSTIREGGDNSK